MVRRQPRVDHFRSGQQCKQESGKTDFKIIFRRIYTSAVPHIAHGGESKYEICLREPVGRGRILLRNDIHKGERRFLQDTGIKNRAYVNGLHTLYFICVLTISYTLCPYERSVVLTVIFSPASIKRGTIILAPVSNVTSLRAEVEAVFPFTAGSE